MVSKGLRLLLIFSALISLTISAFAVDTAEQKDSSTTVNNEKVEQVNSTIQRMRSIRERLAAIQNNTQAAVVNEEDEEDYSGSDADLRAELEALKAQLEGLIEGMNESGAVTALDVATLKKTKLSGYIQFQWEDTENEANKSGKDGFRNRRSRIKMTHQVDDYFSGVIQADYSAGDAGTGFFLKDAYVKYSPIPAVESAGLSFTAGLFDIPFGYEKIRSSSERETPERSKYFDTLFKDQRDSGVMATWGPSSRLTWDLGIFTGLTVGDSERTGWWSRNMKPAIITRMVYGINDNMEAGVSAFWGDRPDVKGSTTTTWVPDPNPATNGQTTGKWVVSTTPDKPAATRNFYNLEFRWLSLFGKPGDTLRAEYLWGTDRIPGASSKSDVEGYYVQYVHDFGVKNTFAVRYDVWEPNMATANNRVTTLSLAWVYKLSPAMRVTLGFDHPEEEVSSSSTQKSDDKWTVRVQYKY